MRDVSPNYNIYFFQKKTNQILVDKPKMKRVFINDDKQFDINIYPEEETIWMSEEEISELFETPINKVHSIIAEMISQEGEEVSIHKSFSENKQRIKNYYNLRIVTEVGYRTMPRRTIKLIRWVYKTSMRLNSFMEQMKTTIDDITRVKY